MQNPVLKDIEKLLRQSAPAPLTEIAIFQELKRQPYFQALGRGKLALFQKHFLITNAIYELQDLFFKEGLLLEVGPLEARLLPLKNFWDVNLKEPSDCALACDLERKAWYMDWRNYETATPASVQKLLDNFWKIYRKQNKRKEALKILGLAEDASNSQQVRKQYRKLVLMHHPDRGGDRREFEKVQSAWLVLQAGFLQNG